MNVYSIRMCNFLSHKETFLNLPAQGVVLVTGTNGSGKSSLIEAVSVGFWGQTIRGTPPWAGPNGEVAIEADVASVRRMVKKSKTKLEWAAPAEAEPVAYESPTKAQEALEGVAGPWEVWRRCSVFSSSDATHFSLATDGERKRLLEKVLGIDRFDTALEACRSDLRAVRVAVDAAERACAIERERVKSEQRRVDEATAWLGEGHAEVPDLTTLREKVDSLKALAATAERDLRAMAATRGVSSTSSGELTAIARQARQTLERLRESHCPTCGQEIPSALRERLEAAAKAAQEAATRDGQAISEQEAQDDALYEELAAERRAIDVQLMEATQAERSAFHSMERDSQVRATLSDAKRRLGDCSKALAEQEARHAAALLEQATLTACESVLGLKGVRAHVLSRALGGIEAVANVWLSRVADRPLQLKLAPYTESKKGVVSDSISLDIIGAGDGHGYKASSAGERRRLDVGLLLALADIAAASHAGVGGTLFFDEVFDLLDDDGVARISTVLQELARDRCVVIISHSPALAASLKANQHVVVDSGVITVQS